MINSSQLYRQVHPIHHRLERANEREAKTESLMRRDVRSNANLIHAGDLPRVRRCSPVKYVERLTTSRFSASIGYVVFRTLSLDTRRGTYSPLIFLESLAAIQYLRD